jgi:hypothetical protein
MKRYNLCNLSEDVTIKPDCYGDWVRYEDVKESIDLNEQLKNELGRIMADNFVILSKDCAIRECRHHIEIRDQYIEHLKFRLFAYEDGD